jgi:hypothetical protein
MREMPEKDDMDCPNREDQLPGAGRGSGERAVTFRGRARLDAAAGADPSPTGQQRPISVSALESLVAGPPRQVPQRADERALRCVSSGYLSHGCPCEAEVPAEVVVAAWARERTSGRGDRFFKFVWHGGVWLGYGLRNGRVRGVYCPEHSAERAERQTIDRIGPAAGADAPLLAA